MGRKNSEGSSKKLLTLIAAILLVVIVVFSFTACSVFTDAVKGMFSGESSTINANETGTEEQPNTNHSTEGSGETTEGSGETTEHPGEDPADHTGEVADPPIEVSSSVVTISTPLVYDKYSRTDMEIQATHEGFDFYQVLGMGLINDGPNARVDVRSHTTGSSLIKLDGHYLSSLDAGNYYFYYCVNDSQGNIYYDPFRLEIKNSVASPLDVKIDYDVDCPNVFVTFRCDCGGAHTVRFDSTNYDAAAGATRVRIGSINKTVSHTADVTCAQSGQHTSVTKTAPEVSAYSNGFLDRKYGYMGHSADGFIEDDGEAADLFEYLAYDGTVINKKVYVSSAIHNEIIENASAYLSKIQSMISVPWSLHFGISYSSASKEVTFSIQDTGAGAVISTEYEDARPYHDLDVVSHYQEQNVRNKGGELPIDNKKGVDVRNVKELLLAVEKGYRPVATGDTLRIYDKARDFCYTYLTDDMTVVEKLHVIYDYLAGEIDYDYAALDLYTLIGGLPGKTLDAAKAEIDAALADASKRFTENMRTTIIAARDAATSTNDLIARLKEGYLQRLSAFSIEGVFDDGAAVCEGISYAFMLLARIEGIECYQISGYATQGGWVAHAWNKVHVDGFWYCVDATWGNVYLQNEKYVTHRYFMVDEAVFDKDHKEKIGDLGAGVETLALGDIEYYKSVETSALLHTTLFISNRAELNAAMAYYATNGSSYIEVLIDPTYKPTAQDFIAAYQLAKPGHFYSITYNNEGRVFVAYFVEV